MGDFTAIIMAADNPVPESPGRWRQGEIVDVLERILTGPPHPRFFHIFVTGYPDAFGFERIRSRLVQLHDETPDPVDGAPAGYRCRRNAVLDFDSMPPGQRNRLFNDRTLSITWGTAKTYVRKRVVGDLTLGDFIDDADF